MGASRRSLAGSAQVCFTGVVDGDLAATADGAAERRRAVVDLPWATLRQVHGADVVVVRHATGAEGRSGDGIVTDVEGLVVAVLTADCAPVALASREGVVGVAHAGWRGLRAGVVQATVAAMRALGATRIEAAIGPCIAAPCYRFGEDDLRSVESVLGPSVRREHRDGGPALDVAAGVAAALDGCGAELVATAPACTACDPGLWSWRGAKDTARQATAVWTSRPAEGGEGRR